MKNFYKYIGAFLIIFAIIAHLVSCNKDTPKVVKKPKNIILLIGDGMGLAHIYAAMTANNGFLNFERCSYSGYSKTYSADNYITDSGAGATAISTGHKTKNKYIAVDTNGIPLKTILEIAEENGLATGLVATSSITHATPAAFIAHDTSRYNQYEIAHDFLDTDIDVFIGGGKMYFDNDNKDSSLIEQLKQKNYQLAYSLSELKQISSGKLAALIADKHPASILDGRGAMLETASMTAINILSKNDKGFFLMIEASQIDWGSHNNNQDYVIAEMLDFDKVIGKVLDFAEKDGNTLVLIVADHETGGITITGGNLSDGSVELNFSTDGHTSVPVPVFAFGPGSENFTGIFENTELFNKMVNLYGF